MEALTPLDRTLRIKMYKNNAQSRLFLRIAKRSIDIVKLLRELKHSLRIVLCRESPYNLINALGHFSVVLQPSNLCQIEFTDAYSAGKAARKIRKILRSSGF